MWDAATLVVLGGSPRRRLARRHRPAQPPLPDSAQHHRYTIVAAPRLHRTQRLADELFGGSSLGHVSRTGPWYAAEAVQLRQCRSARAGDRWQIALARGTASWAP